MPDLEPLLQNLNSLTPLAVGLVVVAGLLVGIAPSSFPLLSVAAGLAAGQVDAGKRHVGFWLSVGFALGIATIDAVIGFLFGLAGFAVMRVLASLLAVAYGALAVLLTVTALALLRVIRVAIPVFVVPSPKPAQSFLRSYIVGLPFGLSTCPACTPLVLPVVAAAAATADPVMGSVLMFTFGLARGVPIIVTGTVAGKLFHAKNTRAFIRWAERIGAALMLGAAAYFVHQAALYAGWLSP